MICIDTNVAIGLLKERPASILTRFWQAAERDVIALSIIELFELQFGVENSGLPARNARRLADFLELPISVLPFGEADAEHAADIRADLKRRGTPIGPYDVLIAAQARCRGATLVTANTREFARVSALTLEDWTI